MRRSEGRRPRNLRSRDQRGEQRRNLETQHKGIMAAVKADDIVAVRAQLKEAIWTRNTKELALDHALRFSAQIGRGQLLSALLDDNANKDAADSSGATPLFIAARDNRVDIVKRLLQAGVDTDKAKPNGATPLHIAVSRGHVDVLCVLAEAGANVQATMQDGSNVLHIASQIGDISCVAVLLNLRFFKRPHRTVHARWHLRTFPCGPNK